VKVSAAAVHKALRESLGVQLAHEGFKRVPGTSFAMSKADGPSNLTLWAQCDKYGWDSSWGSSFTIELQWSAETQPGAASMLERARFAHLLEPGELEQLRTANNSIIASLPGHAAGKLVTVTDTEGVETVVVGYTPCSTSYSKGWDVSLHYSSLAHVESWASYLAPVLLVCGSRLQSAAKSI